MIDFTESADPGPQVSSTSRNAWWLELRALLHLAIPLAATQLAQMAILATDTLMLGHLSKQALAAAALGNTVYYFAWLAGCGPANAVSPMIAHAVGEGAEHDVRGIARMGLWGAIIMTVPLMLVLFLTRPIMLALGEAPVLAADAGRFMSTLCWGLPFAIGFQVLRNYATALARPVAPMIVVLLAIIFNAIGDYALIFGHFGAPRLGLFGSGLASALSNLFSFLAMLAVVHLIPTLRRHRILAKFGHAHWPRLRELFRLGIPIAVTTLFEIMLFNSATVIMGLFGTTTLAAHQIAIIIPSITFMVPLGIGLAATVRVGLAAGAGDAVEARRAGLVAIGLAVVFMSVSALVLVLFPQQIAGAWLNGDPGNADVIALAVVFLHVAAAFQIVDGIQVTSAMALRGLKDAHAPMWLAGASYWLAGFPLCIALGFWFHMQGLGVWIGLAFGLAVAAVLLVWRFLWLSEKAIKAQH